MPTRRRSAKADPDLAIRLRWREWAERNGVEPSHLEDAVEAAIGLGHAGGSADACAAAAEIAGGIARPLAYAVLDAERLFLERMLAELGQDALTAGVEPAAVGALRGRLTQRRDAVQTARARRYVREAGWTTVPVTEAEAGPATRRPSRPTPPVGRAPEPRPPARRPLGPSLRQFAGEHSILLISYTGAFLLIVATVLYELYGVVNLGPEMRFGGVLALDLVFGAAGWACFHSRRLRLVGDTYVAIAALLTPLVFVAAYVFFSLQAQGISIDLALLVTGAACTLLYSTLTLRLGSQGYGVMALAALAATWLGAVDLAGIGLSRGPVFAALAIVYVLVSRVSQRLPLAGDRFSRFAWLFVHAALAFGLGLLVYDGRALTGWPAWVVTATLAVGAATYLLDRALGGPRLGSALGQALLLAALLAGLTDAGAGSWRGPVLAMSGLVFAALWQGPGRVARLRSLFGAEAEYLLGAAAGGGLLALAYDSNQAGQWLPWHAAVVLGSIAAAYGLAAALGAGRYPVAATLASAGLAWTAAVYDLHLGVYGGAVVAAVAVAYPLCGLPRLRATRLGSLAFEQSRFHLYLAGGVAVLFALAYRDWSDPAGGQVAGTLAVLALALGLHAALADQLETAIAARVVFGATWVLTVHDLGLGPWRGTADTALATLYALSGHPGLKLGSLSRLLAARRAWLVGASAAVAVGLTLYDFGPDWAAGNARLALTLAGLTVAYLLFAWLGGGRTAAVLALSAAGAGWLAGVEALPLQQWTAVAYAAAPLAFVTVVAAGGRLGQTGALLAREARWAVHPSSVIALALAAQVAAEAQQPNWPTPILLALVAAVYLAHWYLVRRPLALLATAIGVSLTVLSANAVLNGGDTGAAIELAILAAGWAYGATRASDPLLRRLLWLGVLVQALLPLAVAASPDWLEALVLVACAGTLAATARHQREPLWLLPAGLPLVGAWFWMGAQLLPAASQSVELLAQLFAPAAVVAGLTGLAMRAGIGRRWAVPVYGYAAAIAAGVTIGFLSTPDLALAGRWLLVFAALAYTVAAVERSSVTLAIAVGVAAGGVTLNLAAAGAAPLLYPVALGGLSVAVYAGHLAWAEVGGRGQEWMSVHRYLGLGGSALTALSGFALPDYTPAGSLGCGLAGLAVVVFGALLFFDGRRYRRPEWDYAAVFAASLAGYFAARYFAASNPEWYVVGPGLALTGCGLRVPFDTRLSVPAVLPRTVVAVGAALVLGVTAVEAVIDQSWGNTGLLVAEGAVALLAGIGFRNRVLVIAGGAAIGFAGVRSLFVLVQQGLLFAAFGAVAIVLLGLGAGLALLRERFHEARTTITEQWRHWA